MFVFFLFSLFLFLHAHLSTIVINMCVVLLVNLFDIKNIFLAISIFACSFKHNNKPNPSIKDNQHVVFGFNFATQCSQTTKIGDH